ncbi:MAG: PD-(D/E)XK nuclease family protein, partial [Candidatus Binatia bacterium]
LSSSVMGKLAHIILNSFYQELIDRSYFTTNSFSVDVRATLEAATRRAFSDYEMEGPVGYPVAWEIVQEELAELLGRVVTQDLQELSQSGYRPLMLEVEAKERLKGKWPVSLGRLTIHGRMDRIDHQPEQNRYRVIDYKLKSGRNRSPEDNNLPRSALRGQRLQPPFYLLLAKRFVAPRGKGATDPTFEAAFHFLAPAWPKGPLVAELLPEDAWDGKLGEGLKETLSLLLDGIHQGRFFIHPGPYCARCEVSEVCRKNHLPTLWRAESDPVAKPHRNLRQKNLIKENSDQEKKPHSRRKKGP